MSPDRLEQPRLKRLERRQRVLPDDRLDAVEAELLSRLSKTSVKPSVRITKMAYERDGIYLQNCARFAHPPHA